MENRSNLNNSTQSFSSIPSSNNTTDKNFIKLTEIKLDVINQLIGFSMNNNDESQSFFDTQSQTGSDFVKTFSNLLKNNTNLSSFSSRYSLKDLELIRIECETLLKNKKKSVLEKVDDNLENVENAECSFFQDDELSSVNTLKRRKINEEKKDKVHIPKFNLQYKMRKLIHNYKNNDNNIEENDKNLISSFKKRKN
jgi:hypothetical protein